MDRGFEEWDDKLPCRYSKGTKPCVPCLLCILLQGNRATEHQCTRNAYLDVSLHILNLLSLTFRTLVSHLYFSTSLESSTSQDLSKIFYCSS